MGIAFILLSFSLIFSGYYANAEKLTYFSPEPKYEVEHTGKFVQLRTPTRTLKVIISKCNETWVTRFWDQTKKNYAKFPVAKGKMPDGFAELDGKRRKITFQLEGNPLATVPEDFLTLVSLDQYKCKS